MVDYIRVVYFDSIFFCLCKNFRADLLVEIDNLQLWRCFSELIFEIYNENDIDLKPLTEEASFISAVDIEPISKLTTDIIGSSSSGSYLLIASLFAQKSVAYLRLY